MTRTLLSLALIVCACEKAEVTREAAKSEPPVVPPSGLASPTPAATLAVTPPPPSQPSKAPTQQAGAGRPATPNVQAVQPPIAASADATPLAPGVGMHFDAPAFSVDAPPPAACEKGALCTFPVRVTAKGEFHVNKEYPSKLKMDEATGARFEGKDPQAKTVFSKSAGDFALDGEKAGVMTVRFTPVDSGALACSGVLKLSVCNASNCMLEQAQVRVTVPVR